MTPPPPTTRTRDDATAVRRIVLDEVRANQPGADQQIEPITDDVVLGSGGLGISSLLLLRIFVRIEESFQLTFEDAAVAGATFTTVGDLVRFVGAAVRDHQAAQREVR
jgi:acyl carrier protein